MSISRPAQSAHRPRRKDARDGAYDAPRPERTLPGPRLRPAARQPPMGGGVEHQRTETKRRTLSIRSAAVVIFYSRHSWILSSSHLCAGLNQDLRLKPNCAGLMDPRSRRHTEGRLLDHQSSPISADPACARACKYRQQQPDESNQSRIAKAAKQPTERANKWLV